MSRCIFTRVAFLAFMGGISRCSQVVEGLDFGGLGISSSGYLQFALERFVAEREAAGMRISSSMAEILFFPTLSYDHKFWVVTQRMRSWI